MRKSTQIQALEDEQAFTQVLAGALEQLGWEIVHRPARESEPLIVRRPSTYRIMLRYIHHQPRINRILIYVLFGGRGSENLSLEALHAANRLNDTYNLAKLSFDEDGDVWCQTVFPFGAALDVELFSAYLEWWDAALTAWAQEHLKPFVA
ncbi:YbjN domain-containing protein [Thermoflexus sp.]|uniref:YbjN domain-containing protein n=1 Tax=Thermoflexus sp. TaxID=1969742 RepID=UPI0025F23A15|nr:YbjN domain-containing protein [Thermoflexus sp.]MDW8065202.1 YbjN domain-containing protein [Anaerolineae bacterium]MCS6963781.1 YbjN domain-containing protein [Thermoflexus sp.]MCS7350771.1 YbjN domain-containing protein [Thermoflexus sp.]MCX7689855.1 YbjN domain-containing protein [Thermoflexus sp.]MDW8180222.1 YbjN domain-containing protein [Anaerolineae bacterium]